MSALSLLVCEGIMDEAFLKNRPNHINECVMDNPVSEMRGAYHPRLRVAHDKRFHRRRRIREVFQFFLQFTQVIFQIHLKFKHIILLRFSLSRPSEGKLKVFTGTYERIEVSVSFHASHGPQQNPQNASPGHSERIVGPIVGIDVPPVVPVPVVVVAADQRPQW